MLSRSPLMQVFMGNHNEVAILYGSMALFHTIIHNVFLLYYLDMFVSVFKISKTSFLIGEVVFLIWNSINDPLFGWMSDRDLLKSSSHNSNKYEIIRKRLQILKRSGPLLALSFALFWFSWIPVSIQFVVCLCLYDSFLTSVDLQHTALLADLSVFISERAKLNKCSSIFSAIGSASVFVSYMFWDKNSILPFQTFCIIIAMFSTFGFVLSTSRLLNHYDQLAMKDRDFFHTQVQAIDSVPSSMSCFSGTALKEYMFQLKNNHNFKWFVSINLVQVFHCHFNSNFFPLFLETLLSRELVSGVGPFLIGLSFVLPHINNVYFLGLCENYGVYSVIRGLFIVKLLLALVMIVVGSDSVWLLCIFIASNRIFTEGTCRLLNLVISDLVDEDYVKHQRNNAASALLFGMSSLLAKPGQTIAPLLGTWLLAKVTGEDIFTTMPTTQPLAPLEHHLVESTHHRNGCFLILTLTPFVCAIIQLLAWSQFTLHGNRLEAVKRARLRMGAELPV